ncbi:hypothetical protein AAMO2058_001626800 [Amorphochlora amoebiformis]
MVRGSAKIKAQEKRLKKLNSDRSNKKNDGKSFKANKAAGLKLVCGECKASFPNIVVASDHFNARHPKKPFPSSWQAAKDALDAEARAETERKAQKKKKAKEKAEKLSKIRMALTKFYEENAPDKAGNIEKIMTKYDGKWDKLEAGLKKSYGEKAPTLV